MKWHLPKCFNGLTAKRLLVRSIIHSYFFESLETKAKFFLIMMRLWLSLNVLQVGWSWWCLNYCRMLVHVCYDLLLTIIRCQNVRPDKTIINLHDIFVNIVSSWFAETLTFLSHRKRGISWTHDCASTIYGNVNAITEFCVALYILGVTGNTQSKFGVYFKVLPGK